jgi:hypothetical protein
MPHSSSLHIGYSLDIGGFAFDTDVTSVSRDETGEVDKAPFLETDEVDIGLAEFIKANSSNRVECL